jgi:hypothetical protein
MECLRHADPLTGTPAYPEPEKGYLEQDADLLLAFAVMDAYRAEQERVTKQKEQVATMLKEQNW